MARNRFRRSATALIAVSTVALALAACSSSSSTTASSASTTSPAASAGSASSAASAPASGASAPASGAASSAGTSGSATSLAEVVKGLGGVPPTSAPAPQKGKSVWWISCGQQAASCASFSAAAKDAAEALGWQFHLADSNQNIAGGAATAVRTAIAAHADAIIQDGISCPTDQTALEEAKQAGIAVMGLEALDCTVTGGPNLFTVPIIYNSTAADGKGWWTSFGTQAARYINAVSGGKASVITAFGSGDPEQTAYQDGFKTELAKCSGCTVAANVDWTRETLTPSGPFLPAVRTALLQHPNVTYMFFPFDDDSIRIGGAKAVRETAPSVKVLSGQGSQPGFDAIRSGLVDADAWVSCGACNSWAAMDEVNRYFNKQPAVSEGLPIASVDTDHNLPAAGQDFVPAYDFKALYKKAWGVS